MCFFSRPSPPPAPEPEPVDSAIEETADQVVVGDKKKKKKIQDTQMKVGKKQYGTQSLQIPLASENSSNLSIPK